MANMPRYVDVNRELFPKVADKDTTAVFLYSGNIFSAGELKTYSDGARTVAYSGVIYVPKELFTEFLGVFEDEGKKALTKGAKTYSYKDTEKKQNGISYIPALEAAEALGICARKYLNKLVVFAKVPLLDKIEKDEALLASVLYTLTGVYSTEHVTSEDFTAIKKKWCEVLFGSERTNDISDPDVRKKLDDTAASARKTQEQLNRGADRVILFGENPPVASADLTTQYRNLYEMAKGYATFGAESYHDEALLSDILDSLSWMYENMYGDSVIEGRGWRDAHEFNWWDWFVGGPMFLTKIMLAVEEHLTMEEKQNYLKCLKWIFTVHRVGYRSDFASSRIIVAVPAALLLEDRELLYSEFLDYDLLLEETGPVKGKYTDLVCWTHHYPYNMMYGFAALDRTFFTGAVLSGTAAQFKSPKEYEMFDLVKYMYEAACYKGQGFVIFNGRANMGTEFASGVRIVVLALPMIGYFGADEDNYLKRMVKRFCSAPEMIKMVKKACSLYDLSVLNSILEDDNISGENDYQLTYAWFTADRIAHHRDDYAFLLAMSSERHPSYESINSANKRGWYTGDGALYFYTDTDRHSFDGENFITNPEITKRIPGTTTDSRDMKPWSYRTGWRSPKDFAGCMDMYSSFGIGAFDYSAYHYEGHEADGTVDDGYGGDFVYYENDLAAKKSYFFFDGEVLCLGAGINSTMNSPVRTTVEHRRLVKPEGEQIKVDEMDMPKGEFTEKRACGFVYIEGFAGYIFPEGGEIETRRYIRRETTKLDRYFERTGEDGEQYCAEINILHGENPRGGKYAYIILPYATPETIKAYEEAPRVEILENSPACQAARKPSAGVTMMALYEPCCRFGVKSDIPAIIMLGERDGILKFSVCDPTQKKPSGTFILGGVLELISASPELSVKIEDGKAVIEADLTELAGKNLTAEFKIK